MTLTKYMYYCMNSVLFWLEVSGFELYNSIKQLLSRKISIIKHILIWTTPVYDPIIYLGSGQDALLQKDCAQMNCYVTASRTHYNFNITDFDMVIFHGPQFLGYNANIPVARTPQQIYVFASMEAPVYFPICHEQLNGFFNWTWTYRLKSDICFGYIIIKDKAGKVIGPKEDMNWVKVDNMLPIDDSLRAKLDGKHKAAAWFVSNCKARNNRRQVASEIKDELEKYGYTLDVYGRCGWMTCDWNSPEDCANLVEKDYYFYLSFENSFSEDYVTEKLLRPLKHYAVPVVYGGANYTRFMPDGIYLNARMVDVEDLVKQMVYLMNNKEKYYNYFRWHNHYSYHSPTEFPETDPYCNLCAAINDEKGLRRDTDYDRFDEWWNEPEACPKLED